MPLVVSEEWDGECECEDVVKNLRKLGKIDDASQDDDQLTRILYCRML